MFGTRIIELTPRVLCLRRPVYLSCSYLVLTRDGVVLVDAGMDELGRDSIAGLAHAGLGPKDVRAILLTHWHNDHSSGAETLRQLSGAEVYCSASEAEHLSRRASNVMGQLSAWVPELGLLAKLKGILGQSPVRPVLATRHVRDGEILPGGFRVLETPGHTTGHLSFDLASEGVLFTGDALAVCGGRITYMSRYLTQDTSTARESMRRCLEVDAGILCPGHRAPLVVGVERERRRVLAELDAGKPWPVVS